MDSSIIFRYCPSTPMYCMREGICEPRPTMLVSIPCLRPGRASPSTPTSNGLPRRRAVGSPFGEPLLPRPGSSPSPSGKSPSSPALAPALLVPALVAAPVALAPALERLAVAAPLLLGAHLVERPLHGLHRLV